MPDREKVVKGLGFHLKELSVGKTCFECPYFGDNPCEIQLISNAIAMFKEQEKEIKVLRLLVEWAEECDFGFDKFPDECERYKDEIKGMKYIDGMIHVARRTLEDNGAFEEGR